MGGADDLASLTDGGVPDLWVVAHEGLFGGVQSAGGVWVPLDLDDDGPLPVEHVDRDDAAFLARPDEGRLHLLEHLGQATGAELEQAALLRLALTEVIVRVGRLCPTVSPTACSCGERFATAEELDEHFGAVFVPADDIGLDGQAHAEVLMDKVQ